MRQLQFVLLVGAGQRIRSEAKSVHFEACDLVQARAFQNAVGIAGMDAETVEAASLGVGVKRNLVGVVQSELLDQHGDRSRIGFLQRNLHFEFVGLRGLPFGIERLSLARL